MLHQSQLKSNCVEPVSTSVPRRLHAPSLLEDGVAVGVQRPGLAVHIHLHKVYHSSGSRSRMASGRSGATYPLLASPPVHSINPLYCIATLMHEQQPAAITRLLQLEV